MARRAFVPPESPINLSALGFRVWRARDPFRLPTAHTHADVEVNFLLSGRITYLHGGSIFHVEPFHFTAFWGGSPHCIISPTDETSGILITLPLAWLVEWQLSHGLPARLLSGEVVSARPDDTDLPLLERWVEDFEDGDSGRRRALLLEVQARFHRLALGVPKKVAPARPGRSVRPSSIGQVERSTHYIAQHYREPLTVATIAAGVGLHGKYLMRLFKRSTGMNIWEYVTRMRLAHAQRLLLTTDMKIIDVAFDAGFASIGPFYRAFAAYCPASRCPREYRHSFRPERP